VNVHPGEKIGYVITNAKAKDKAERVRTSNRAGAVNDDRQEFATRLEVAAQELGVISNGDSFENEGYLPLPLFDWKPDSHQKGGLSGNRSGEESSCDHQAATRKSTTR
jgi:hypothetical protein